MFPHFSIALFFLFSPKKQDEDGGKGVIFLSDKITFDRKPELTFSQK